MVVGACSGGAISAYTAPIHLRVDIAEALGISNTIISCSSSNGESRLLTFLCPLADCRCPLMMQGYANRLAPCADSSVEC